MPLADRINLSGPEEVVESLKKQGLFDKLRFSLLEEFRSSEAGQTFDNAARQTLEIAADRIRPRLDNLYAQERASTSNNDLSLIRERSACHSILIESLER